MKSTMLTFLLVFVVSTSSTSHAICGDGIGAKFRDFMGGGKKTKNTKPKNGLDAEAANNYEQKAFRNDFNNNEKFKGPRKYVSYTDPKTGKVVYGEITGRNPDGSLNVTVGHPQIRKFETFSKSDLEHMQYSRTAEDMFNHPSIGREIILHAPIETVALQIMISISSTIKVGTDKPFMHK